MISRRAVVLSLIVLAASGCTRTSVNGQPSTTAALPSQTSASSSPSAPSSTSAPSTGAMPLNGVEACSLLSASALPAAWQPLTTNPAPLLQLGDSNCSISNLETSIGIDITLYRGPGRGIDSLSKTTATPPTPIDVGGRNARIFRDTGGNTCGILFDFGPDQGLIVNGTPAYKSTQDPCEIVTIAATAMVPNLPPS